VAVYSYVRALLRGPLVSADPALPSIAWEGQSYDPPAAGTWLREKLTVVNSVVLTLGTQGMTEDYVMYSIGCYGYVGSRLFDLDDLSDRIMYMYPTGALFTQGSIHCRITSSYRGDVVEDSPYMRCTVTLGATVRRPTHFNP